jgi:hypothetical protein
MMGDKIGEASGKVIGTRVLPAEGGRYVKMEITIQTQATSRPEGHRHRDVRGVRANSRPGLR